MQASVNKKKRVEQLPSPTSHLKNYVMVAFKGMTQLASHKHSVPLHVPAYPARPAAATGIP